MNRKVETRSAVVMASAYLKSISCWPGADLVVRGLDLEAHLLQREHDVAARLFAPIDGRQVEVGALVVRVDDRVPVGVAPEEEELRLGAGDEHVAERRGLVHLLLERHAAGSRRTGLRPGCRRRRSGAPTFCRRCAPRDRSRTSPGPGTRFMSDSSIRVNPSIEDPSNWISPSSALLELRARDLDVLDDPEDVGELESHEPDVLRVADLEDLGLGRPGPAASNFRIFAFGNPTSFF